MMLYSEIYTIHSYIYTIAQLDSHFIFEFSWNISALFIGSFGYVYCYVMMKTFWCEKVTWLYLTPVSCIIQILLAVPLFPVYRLITNFSFYCTNKLYFIKHYLKWFNYNVYLLYFKWYYVHSKWNYHEMVWSVLYLI